MSLLLDPEQSINLVIYCVEKPSPHGFSRVRVINDETEFKRRKELGEDIQEVRTQWRPMCWRDYVTVNNKSMSTSVNEDGQIRSVINLFTYRDSLLKTQLMRWNLEDKSIMSAPTDAQIDKLNPGIAEAMAEAFEKAMKYEEDAAMSSDEDEDDSEGSS